MKEAINTFQELSAKQMVLNLNQSSLKWRKNMNGKELQPL